MGSYQFERLEGREREAGFLAERAQLRLESFLPTLRAHGVPSGGRFLELGCGQGIRTRRLAESFPDAEVLGIDRSPELLAQAMSGPAPGNLRFLESDLYATGLPEAGFSFIYARLVFMHLSEPAKALRELVRLLRPGGVLLLEDADRDCMLFEPAPHDFPWFWQAVQAGQRRLGGDPNVGRKLAFLLRSAGLAKVKSEPQLLQGGGAEIAFLARTLMPSLNAYLPERERARGERVIRGLERLSAHPHASFFHLWFVASGVKP